MSAEDFRTKLSELLTEAKQDLTPEEILTELESQVEAAKEELGG